MARMGELKRAAKVLVVTSTTLRQHGWSTASTARIQAAMDDPPDWLIAARQNRSKKRAKQQRRRVDQSTASRLGTAVRAVKERGIRPTDVEELLAARPVWLLAEQQRQQAHIEQEAKARLCRELTDTLITSLHETWFQELKRATTASKGEATDGRWAPEVGRAKQQVRQLVDQLTPEQIRARIDRDDQAARYRATQLARRAFKADGGR